MMPTKLLHRVLLGALSSVFSLGSACPQERPVPWRDLTLDEALVAGGKEDLPVFVYAGTSGCLGCHRMKKLTWSEVPLVDWLKENAVAIELGDRGVQAHGERLGVVGYPTVLRLEEGKEAARLVGFWSAEDVLAWARDPEAFQRARLSALEGRDASVGDLHDHGLDRMLLGDSVGAARAFAEVWTRARVEPGVSATMRWQRRDRYPSLLRRMAQDPEARPVIAALLDGFEEEGPGIEDHPDLVGDWILLSDVLGREEVLSVWLTGYLSTEQGRAMLSQQTAAYSWLVERERWEEAGRIASPSMWERWVARARNEAVGDPVDDAMPEKVVERERQLAPEKLRTFARCLRAAGRDAEAAGLEEV